MSPASIRGLATSSPRVALVHDWLTGMRGGERCLEVLCELFPEAPLFTLFDSSDRDPAHAVTPTIRQRTITTSFIQHMPFRDTLYRKCLPLFPFAVNRFDLSPYNLVLSISHCAAKAVPKPRDALHISYCLTPMRYIWDRYADYSIGAGPVTRLALATFRPALRRWDQKTSQVDHFIAISSYVADRIRRYYGRAANIVHPPVDVSRFSLSTTIDDFYLVVSALVPYKRVDLAIEAAKRLGRRLIVVGDGPELKRLRRLAVNSQGIELLGWKDDAVVANLFARCRAVIFTAFDDFGIVPLEAAASGRPTIAFGKGGVTDTILDLHHAGDKPPTGVFFHEQTVDSLVQALRTFEGAEGEFNPGALRTHAIRFDRPVFKESMARHIERLWQGHSEQRQKS